MKLFDSICITLTMPPLTPKKAILCSEQGMGGKVGMGGMWGFLRRMAVGDEDIRTLVPLVRKAGYPLSNNIDQAGGKAESRNVIKKYHCFQTFFYLHTNHHINVFVHMAH
jgi:hypothetical protein